MNGFDIITSEIVRGGNAIHNISARIHAELKRREFKKQPFPNAVVFHSNSDKIDDELGYRAEDYSMKFMHLMKYIRSHVKYVMVISPGLYTPQGEIIEHWNDPLQHSIVKIVRIQEKICAKESVAFINLRDVMQRTIREKFKEGIKGVDLTDMIGKKRDWEKTATWDYTGTGGILTFDGEHLNKAGTELLLSLIIDQFSRWDSLFTDKALSVKDDRAVGTRVENRQSTRSVSKIRTDEDEQPVMADYPFKKPDRW